MFRTQSLALVGVLGLGIACAHGPVNPWPMMVAHDRDGQVVEGSVESLIAAIRNGCRLRVAWGARRRNDPARTIEHIADPIWVSVRDGALVEVQLEGFLSNLRILGEPPEKYPRAARFGGTERAVWWRAQLRTDGSFEAIWFDGEGALVERVPQRHPMRWYTDCRPLAAPPLYPSEG